MYAEELEAANDLTDPFDSLNGEKSQEQKEEEAKDAVKLSPFQLSALYSSAQAQYANLPTLEPSPRLKAVLKFYQKQALYFMVQRELSQRDRMTEGGGGTVRRRHPLWDEYSFVDGERFYVNPFNSQIQLEFPESSGLAMGGILGDEMGLGKTVMMINLMLYHHPHAMQTAASAKEEAAVEEDGGADKEKEVALPLLPFDPDCGAYVTSGSVAR